MSGQQWTSTAIRSALNRLARGALPAEEGAAFEKRFPILFAMAKSRRLDPHLLESVLAQLTAVQEQRVTQEAASETVGTLLFDQYVKSAIPSQTQTNGTCPTAPPPRHSSSP
jgi:hypothetical protein